MPRNGFDRQSGFRGRVARTVMVWVRGVLLLALLIVVSASANAQTFVQVAQESAPGANDFDCHVLGIVRAWDYAGSATAFYNYNTIHNVSWGGDAQWAYGPLLNRSHLLIVETTDGLTLVAVHDQPGISNGGGHVETRVDVIGSTTPVARTVTDDPTSDDSLDIYTGDPGSSLFTTTQTWASPNTDGQALSGFAGAWTAYAQFTVQPTGISDWYANSVDGGVIPLRLVPGQRVRLKPHAAPPPNSLLALYTFDDGTAKDVSGSNHLASVEQGSPAFVANGYDGVSLNLDGTGWLMADMNIGPTSLQRLTLGAWARPSIISIGRTVLSHDNTGFDRTLTIDDRGGGLGWSCFRGPAGGANGNGVLGFFPAIQDQWQFVAAVYNAQAQTVLLYVDGQVLSATGNPLEGLPRFRIGHNPCCGTGNVFSGSLDNVFLLSEALSASRLDEIRVGGYHRIPTCPAIIRQPSCTAACSGNVVSLTLDAAGSELIQPLSYQWRKGGQNLADGGHVSGSTTPSLTISNLSPADADQYDCAVTNGCGSVTSNSVTLSLTARGGGDGNGDGFANGLDISGLVNILVGGMAGPRSCAYDMNADNAVTLADVPLFVALLLGP